MTYNFDVKHGFLYNMFSYVAGDPDNRSLRRVEREIMIPKMVKEASKEKCAEQVKCNILFYF